MQPDLSKPFASAASTLPLPRVDSHFHVFAGGVAAPGARYQPAYDAPLSAWQAAAAACGVTHGVLVQVSFLGTDNSALLATLQTQPGRLRGVAVVAPDTPPAHLATLHAAGVRGMRLNLAGTDHHLDAWARATRLWDALAVLGWHIEVHTDTGALPRVIHALPGNLPLVVDHMGKPGAVSMFDPTVSALLQRARRAAVFVKLSGAYRLEPCEPRALARLWHGELGPHALLWGSDWPCTNHEAAAVYERLLGALYDWLDAPAAEAALTVNPARLYWDTRTPAATVADPAAAGFAREAESMLAEILDKAPRA